MKKNSGTFEISKRTAYFGDALGSGMIRLDMEPGTYAYAVRRRKGNMSYVNICRKGFSGKLGESIGFAVDSGTSGLSLIRQSKRLDTYLLTRFTDDSDMLIGKFGLFTQAGGVFGGHHIRVFRNGAGRVCRVSVRYA